MKRVILVLVAAFAACGVESQSVTERALDDGNITVTPVAELDQPWAMVFLPDGRLLVSEKRGRLRIVTQSGDKSKPISGLPAVDYGGQGGLGDVCLHPDFANNGLLYFSFVESGSGNTRGAVVMRGKLDLNGKGGQIQEKEIIWRQDPKVTGRGHYGHRIVFSPDGYLYVSSGDRQKFTPAQDMQGNLGKIVRLNPDGSLPGDNPFTGDGGIAAQVWSLGHRNPLGLAFDAQGRFWNHEMGPSGGDELNLVEPGNNYGYPIVSNGDHYDGREIPDHNTRAEFTPPKVWWTPVISPAGLMFYSGNEFPQWKGDGFIAGLSSQALVRLEFDGNQAREAERFAMGERIRAVVQGPNGAIWLLEDGKDGRLLKLTAAD